MVMLTHYQKIKGILDEAELDYKDEEAGVPRRHFIEIEQTNGCITFRFNPDGSLAEVYFGGRA